jgi:hypothetical protein
MLKILGFTIFLYVVLKLCRLMVRPVVADPDAEATGRIVARAGEPMLLIGTFGLSLLLASYATWWNNQFLEGHYAYASGCYARMAASHHLPARPERFGSMEAADAASNYVWSAELHGGQLGMRRDVIDKKLDQARIAYSNYYSGLAATNARQKIAASFRDLDRCLNGKGRPRGELLTPNV